MKPIMRVTAVNLAVLKSLPPQLAITAFGEVSSGGWKNGTLVPRHVVTPPADGLWDFDFVADSPTGIAIQVIRPISALTTLTSPPAWLKGIRVRAAQGSQEAPLDQSMVIAPSKAMELAAAGAGSRKVSLAMTLDPDVSLFETAVWLEGQFVDGWTWNGKAHVRTYDAFPVAGTLDVRADARSKNEPNIAAALQLAVVVDGGTPNQLRVDTQKFFGYAEASYHV